MNALLRLIELLRIAQQDEILGRGYDGEGIGEGELPRHVDEEQVDAADHVFAAP